jgi:hypothetical protein
MTRGVPASEAAGGGRPHWAAERARLGLAGPSRARLRRAEGGEAACGGKLRGRERTSRTGLLRRTGPEREEAKGGCLLFFPNTISF